MDRSVFGLVGVVLLALLLFGLAMQSSVGSAILETIEEVLGDG